MKPSTQILEKAIAQVKSSFTKDVMPFGMAAKKENHFIISVTNVRMGQEFLIDYTFTVKTGKMVSSELIESRYLDMI